MIRAVPDVLSRIVDHKRSESAPAAAQVSAWERQARSHAQGRRDFRQALIERPPAIIAEIKKASPSKGLLAGDFRPGELASAYESGGAAALSVLTDREFFQGSLADLAEARARVRLPVLRKDFTVEEYHVLEAAAHGADAVLLIAAILGSEQLRLFRELAEGWGMAALVEVHQESELETALASGARIIGVNNRDLHTFEVSLDISLRLAGRIPAGVVKVSESGIHDAGDVRRLREAGFDAFLVGERLMKAQDPRSALEALRA